LSYKGYFKPRNPHKYKGDPTRIVYRSLWELHVMSYLDKHPDVIQWASEEFSIPYRDPSSGRMRRYFPDFWVKKVDKDGELSIAVIEVKPAAQCKPPVVKKKRTRAYVREVYTWGINSSKWEAAKEYCADRQWEFQILTEKDIYGAAIGATRG
jgi:hypothetical protein